MKKFALFGNPVKHSKSPRIHELFSKNIGIKYSYISVNTEINKFSYAVKNFFSEGGDGANITIPFKKQALQFCTQLTNRALLSGSVNTLKKINTGEILGDNTDGIGFLMDLKRLNLIQKKDNVLLIGSGGAARGIILSLFSINCTITLTNRTQKNAEHLANFFHKEGKIDVMDFNNLYDKNFNLIINATSSSMTDTLLDLPSELINSTVSCYDVFYKKKETVFLKWCRFHGANKLSDGLGMLVGQAAYSCLLWHNILPNIRTVINILKEEI